MNDTLIPFENLVSDEELHTRYGSVTVTPNVASDWAFRLVLPRDWIQDPSTSTVAPAIGQLAQLGLFAAQDHTVRPVGVQVWGTLIPFEVNLVDWLQIYIDQNSMDLIEKHILEFAVGPVVDSLVAHLHGSQRMLTRLTASSDSDHVYLVAGMAAERVYKSFARTLGLAAVSFYPLQKTGSDFMENMAIYQDPARRMWFQYPNSWNIESLKTSPLVSAVALRLQSSAELLAYLRVQTVVGKRDYPAQAWLEPIRKDLAAANVNLVSLDSVLSERDAPSKLWAGEAEINDTHIQCVIAIKPMIRRANEGNVAVGQTGADELSGFASVLLCPLRQRQPLLWMRSKRAFEIVQATLRAP